MFVLRHLVIAIILSVVGEAGDVLAQSSQNEDFSVGTFFTVADFGSGIDVYSTDPHSDPLTRTRLMTIPALRDRTERQDGIGYDAVRNLLYAVGIDSNFQYYVLKINPAKREWGYVRALPSECASTTFVSIRVDPTTGYLYCSGHTRDATAPFASHSWIVRIDPDTGIIEKREGFGSGLPVIDPLNHVIYAQSGSSVVRLDPQTLQLIDTVANNPDNYPFEVYDSISNSLFGARWFFNDQTSVHTLRLAKLNLTTNELQTVVKGSLPPFTTLTNSSTMFVLDEANRLLYLNSLAGGNLKVDISQPTLPSEPLVDFFRFPTPAIVRQVILLDWTRPSSTGWKRKRIAAEQRTIFVPDSTAPSSLVTMDPQTFRKPILQQVRRIFNGVPTSERTHVHIPVLEYVGPSRATAEQKEQNATYVRFVDKSAVPPSALPAPKTTGKAWDIVPAGGCSVDQFNRRKSGEVVVFTDSARLPEDIGITVAHEIGHALGLRHGYHPNYWPLSVMDYGRGLPGSLEVFPPVEVPIREEPAPTGGPDRRGYNTSSPLFHLRHYVLGEPVNSPLVTSLPIGDWDASEVICKTMTVTSNSPTDLYDFAILSASEDDESDGEEVLTYRDGRVAHLPGLEATSAKGAPLKIVASTVPGGDWDLYFVGANNPSQLELPDSALPPGPFAGKILKYVPATQGFTEVGTFSMNITEYRTAAPSGPLPVNTPPVASAGADQNVSLPVSIPSVAVTLNGGGSSDVDGDSLNYYWSGPFEILTGPIVTVNLPGGVHVVTLSVSDGKGGTSSDTVTINVVPTVAQRGDFDSDKDVDIRDVMTLFKDLTKTVSNSSCGTMCDLDGDGRITLRDVLQEIKLCTRPFCRTENYKGHSRAEDEQFKSIQRQLR